MPLLSPPQNILYLESFASTSLADATLHITSCKPHDWPLNKPTFHEHTLKFWCDNCNSLARLTSNINPTIRDTFNLVVSSHPFTLNCIANCHIIHCSKVLQLDALPNANLLQLRKTGCFPETPSQQIIEFLQNSTKCLYNLLHIHQKASAVSYRTAHTRPIVRIPLAALALPVITMEM